MSESNDFESLRKRVEQLEKMLLVPAKPDEFFPRPVAPERVTFQEFSQRQGCPYIETNIGYLFANGARSNGEFYHIDPPTDQDELLELRIAYLKPVLANEERRLRNVENQLATQAQISALGAGPSVAAELKKKFAALQSRVGELTRELKAAESALTPKAVREFRQREERRERENRERKPMVRG
jgi:hypothetical protein